VTFELSAPTPDITEVVFGEEPIGAARLMAALAAPLAVARNTRSLDRLERVLDGPSRVMEIRPTDD
jgi:hypothetical protein